MVRLHRTCQGSVSDVITALQYNTRTVMSGTVSWPIAFMRPLLRRPRVHKRIVILVHEVYAWTLARG